MASNVSNGIVILLVSQKCFCVTRKGSTMVLSWHLCKPLSVFSLLWWFVPLNSGLCVEYSNTVQPALKKLKYYTQTMSLSFLLVKNHKNVCFLNWIKFWCASIKFSSKFEPIRDESLNLVPWLLFEMVSDMMKMAGYEPSTSGLCVECSTTVLPTPMSSYKTTTPWQ
jgi:hypothetical protein